ncbi:flagellar hook-associated protein FlgK [Neorhizobium sp. CSC1952]|uniref:flagellar hook-associated protein FlgK n=1 Tax=Neorhizobium sp. CSC1952 TaxID=2978974 RepID=UPI0025A4E248|nr:flagellar hook-associated protein FlgK [Rhizobium sp. CSC1952]WJR65166.1 flagellar hook-associated protein FlgK [Rhizobium sp. CSC1952]
MSLSSTLSTAQAILSNTGTQAAVVAKNLANAQNPDYVRRSAPIVAGGNGAVVGDIVRAGNPALLRQTIESSSAASGQRTLLDGLNAIKNLMGGNDNEFSPAKLIAALQNNLDAFAAKANDIGLGLAVLASAQDVAAGLKTASDQLQGLRKQADEEIGNQVGELNALLSQFQEANDRVKNLTATGGDPNDALDTRDGLLKKISEIVGVTASLRDGNDMVLYTSDGTTLFETVPRKVTFQPTASFDASTPGNGIAIDGVPLRAGQGGDTTAKGSLQALLQLRDQIAPVFQSQLDEIARGLVTAFAETGPDGTLVPMAGLFTYKDETGALQTAVPAAGAIVPGLASRLVINPAVVPPVGSMDALRDGGMNGAEYRVNTGGSSYAGLIDQYNRNLEAPMAFDPATAIGDSRNLLSFATMSVGWLEQLRSSATHADEAKYAMLSRSLNAYSSATGVSLDEELSLLLDIEQAYKAAAKLLRMTDEMVEALLKMGR